MTTFSFKFLTTPSATAAAAAATATGTTMSVREFRMSQGLAPVHRAARGNDVSTLAKLLASGVNANLKTANDSRHTPLMMAAERGHIECVRLLVEHGAQIEARDWEGPAAFKACVNGHTDVICYFLFKGANVNARSTDGQSLLRIAATRGYTPMVEVLLAFGSDLESVCGGRTALLHAVAHAKPETTRILLELGADTTKADPTGFKATHTFNESVRELLSQHAQKSELERAQIRCDARKRIESELAHKLFRWAHREIVGVCLAMSSLELTPYVLLWIIDWLPNYDRLSHLKKIRLIESVRDSVRKIKRKLLL